jgi:hypothetical protein
MRTDQALLDRDRQDCYRHLAAEGVAILPYVRAEARAVLRLVDDILKTEPPEGDDAPPKLSEDA